MFMLKMLTAVALTSRLIGTAADGHEAATPFQLAMTQRTGEIASAVLNTPAFASCVRERMRRYHISCSVDPNWQEPATEKWADVMAALRGGNHVEVVLSPEGGTQNAPQQGGVDNDEDALAHQGMKYMNWSGNTLEEWDAEMVRVWSSVPGAPWVYSATTMLHELSHAFGYDHPDKGCSDPGACASSECSWTTACGPGREPPTGPNEWGYQKTDSRDLCSWEFSGRDDQYVFGDSDPSIPYIISECVYGLLNESAQECSGGLFAAACAADEIQLRSLWRGGTARDFDGACACRPSGRHAVAFRTAGGYYLSASGGGGGAFDATAGGHGAWQTLYLVDLNGGYLQHNDPIRIRTHRAEREDGYFVGTAIGVVTRRGVVTADRTSGSSLHTLFRIRRQAGPGRVADGDVVSLFATGVGRYLTATDNGGSSVAAVVTTPGETERFIFREPRRSLLVSFRSSDGRYVEYDRGAGADLRTEALRPEKTAGVQRAGARRQAFWIIDHNGGALRSGDWVSLEQSQTGTYWSTCSGELTVRGNANFIDKPCQRFKVIREAGEGEVRHRDPVRLVSGEGFFLTAVPAGYGSASFRIENNRTRPGPWETFRVDSAQGRGRAAARFEVY